MKTLKLSEAELIVLLAALDKSGISAVRLRRRIEDLLAPPLATPEDAFAAGRKAYRDAVGDGPEAA